MIVGILNWERWTRYRSRKRLRCRVEALMIRDNLLWIIADIFLFSIWVRQSFTIAKFSKNHLPVFRTV